MQNLPGAEAAAAPSPVTPGAIQSESEARSRPEPVYRLAMQELLDWLCQSRKRLVLIYLGLLIAWISLILYSPYLMVAPDLFGLDVPAPRRGTVDMLTLVIIGGFLALQAMFLLGGGRIRIRPGRTKWHRLIVSVVIFSALMAVLSLGIIWTYFQLTGRMPTGNRPAKGIEQFNLIQLLDNLGSADARKLVWITGGLWFAWLIIGVIAMRTTDHPRGVGRLVAGLLAGSWVEFAVALPVDLVTKRRDEDCPCVSGSWLALMFCFPILVWSIGPAIYLLFLREKDLCRRDSRHSRRVLLRKSIRDTEAGMPS